MKRITKILVNCLIVTVFLVESLNVMSQTVTVGSLKYDLLNGYNAVVSGIAGQSVTDITIEEKITYSGKEYSVNGVKDNAFEECQNLASVALKSARYSFYFGIQSFKNCKNLKSVDVSYIGNNSYALEIKGGAFSGCENLESVNLGYRCTKIGNYAFEDCIKLKKITALKWISYNPNQQAKELEYIGDYAFKNCESLQNFDSYINPDQTIQDVTHIGEYAFEGCKSFTTFTIPDGVTNLYDGVFKDCSSLVYVKIHNDVKYLGDWSGKCMFEGCSGLTQIELPTSMKKIPEKFFKGCTSLTDIPAKTNDLTEIGNEAFAGCDGFINIQIPATVKKIGSGVFKDCSNLQSIEIPNTLSEIETNMFSGCSNLESIEIPNTVTSLGTYAFDGCEKLNFKTLSHAITSISDYAFNGCKSLTRVTLPMFLQSFGDGVFANCDALESINISSNNEYFTTEDGVLYDKDLKSALMVPNAKQTLSLPGSLERIGNGAFYGCSNIENISFPDNVSSIGEKAFKDCIGIKSLNLKNVSSIYGRAFENCANLNCLEMDSVKYIGEYAFNYCNNLIKVQLPSCIKTVNTGVFANCSKLENINVCPIENESSSYYYSSDGVLYQSSYDNKYLMQVPCAKKTVKILYGTERIYESSFEGCKMLDKVLIPYGVKDIREKAFKNCENLYEVSFPSSVSYIDSDAFEGCYNIGEIYCHWDNPKVTKSNYPTIFEKEVFENAVLFYPEDCYDNYINSEPWKYFGIMHSFKNDESKVGQMMDAYNAVPKTLVGTYDLYGRPISKDSKGIIILLYSDGSSQKIINR